MTRGPKSSELASEVANFFKSKDAPYLVEWFENGFRAIATGDVATEPFGFIRFEYPNAESISEILANAYFEFRSQVSDVGDRNSFTLGLAGAFKRLSVRSEIDRRAVIEVLRLFAKIGYSDALGIIVTRVFPGIDDAEGSIERLRSVALDVAIELSSRHPDPIPCLQGIVRSGLFRREASRTIILALCGEAPYLLLDHLFLLERSLAQVYADTQPIDPDQLWVARCIFFYDLLKATSRNAVIGVIQFAIRNQQWPLSWLRDIPLETWRFDLLPDEISREFTELRSDLNVLKPIPYVGPRQILTQSNDPYPTTEKRLDTDVLLSKDATTGEEDEVLLGLIGYLSGNGNNAASADLSLSFLILKDSEFRDAA